MTEAFDRSLEKNAADLGAGPAAPSGSSESSPRPLGERSHADMGAQDSPFEAALRSNVNRVLKQNKQATRVDPAEAEERASIRAEREAREREENAGRRLPHSLTNGVPGKIQDTVVMAMRRAQRKEAEAEAVRMPSLPADKTLDEKIRASMDWHPLPVAEKRLVKGAHDTVKGEREAAASLGLSYEEAKSAELAKRVELNDALTPLQAAFEQDPKGTWLKFGQEHGLVPKLTAEQEAYHRARAVQAREQGVQRAVMSVVNEFAASRPDFDGLQDTMEAAITNGWVQRTGHVLTDLNAAYTFARQRAGYGA